MGPKKEDIGNESELGAKYQYYLKVRYMKLWRVPLGYICEQSIESFHKDCTLIFRRYHNQRGLLNLKYALRTLQLITSPTCQACRYRCINPYAFNVYAVSSFLIRNLCLHHLSYQMICSFVDCVK